MERACHPSSILMPGPLEYISSGSTRFKHRTTKTMTDRRYYWLSITNVNGVGGSALLSPFGPQTQEELVATSYFGGPYESLQLVGFSMMEECRKANKTLLNAPVAEILNMYESWRSRVESGEIVVVGQGPMNG